MLIADSLDSSLGASHTLTEREAFVSRLRSIGQFAEITGLTTKALRLYDQLSLLKPAAVNSRGRFCLGLSVL